MPFRHLLIQITHMYSYMLFLIRAHTDKRLFANGNANYSRRHLSTSGDDGRRRQASSLLQASLPVGGRCHLSTAAVYGCSLRMAVATPQLQASTYVGGSRQSVGDSRHSEVGSRRTVSTVDIGFAFGEGGFICSLSP